MIRRLLAAVLMAGSVAAFGQPTLHTDLPLSYLAQSAPTTQAPAMVILLHGYGSNETELFALKERLPTGITYLSVRAPQVLGGGRYAWFRQKQAPGLYDGVAADLHESGRLLNDFIAKAAARYHIAPERVVLVGFSQGAMISYQAALTQPEQVGGIAALGGRLLPDSATALGPAASYTHLAVFIGHGVDDGVVGFAGTEGTRKTLAAIGVTPTFHAYPGLGHAIAPQELADLAQWLQRVLKTR